MNWSTTMHLLSEACAALRDGGAAEVLYPRLEPLCDQVSMSAGVRCDGSLGHAAGLLATCLGRWDEAERHFEHALAVNDRIGAKAAKIGTLRAWATMLLERDAPEDRLRAQRMIAEANADAEALALVAEAAKLQRLRSRLVAEPA